jgi:YfiH family protein
VSTARPADVVHVLGDGRSVEVRFSTKADGDFHIEQPRHLLHERRRRFVAGVWTQLDEVHGAEVRTVTRAGEHDHSVGDVLITDLADAVLGVWVGDCAPVALVADDGRIGAVHAGWKGARLGVLETAARAMGSAGTVHAYLGPCVHPCCYEFGRDDLQVMVDMFGCDVESATATGRPALDMRAVVRAGLERCGVNVHDVSACTGCNESLYFSHRRRAETARQMMAVVKR